MGLKCGGPIRGATVRRWAVVNGADPDTTQNLAFSNQYRVTYVTCGDSPYVTADATAVDAHFFVVRMARQCSPLKA
jgi:hypothetical protein